jgi:hypothetical protein
VEKMCVACAFMIRCVCACGLFFFVCCVEGREFGERHEAYVGAEYLQSVELRVVARGDEYVPRLKKIVKVFSKFTPL